MTNPGESDISEAGTAKLIVPTADDPEADGLTTGQTPADTYGDILGI